MPQTTIHPISQAFIREANNQLEQAKNFYSEKNDLNCIYYDSDNNISITIIPNSECNYNNEVDLSGYSIITRLTSYFFGM